MAHGRNNTVVIHPNSEFQQNAHIKSMDEYNALYQNSIEKPDEFWGTIAQDFYWKRPPSGPVFEGNFDIRKGGIFIRWMQGALTNVCYNVLDTNVQKGLGDQIAFYWEGNDPEDFGKITYSELLRSVCKFANVLKRLGVKKGDRVAIYMPMIVELTVAMLACARIGAIHSIIFGGFSAESIADRILDAHCSLLVTCDAVWRGVKIIKLKDIVDDSLKLCAERGHTIANCVVVRHLSPDQYADIESQPAKRPHFGLKIHWQDGRDLWWHELMQGAQDECEPEWMDAEEPLFMLYTSGSTGKPKGVLHTCGGYMIYAATTFKYVFDFHPGDVYWCTADVGWITGHSYVCYGPLANGATSVLFEGIPFWPDAGRCWEIIDKYSVSKFYTAPTALRALMKTGDAYVHKYKRTSLKVLGSVGEPINPEAWLWYYKVVGEERSPICDTFWQTETGGHALTPLPGCTPLKPGSATLPFFGIVPALLDEDGHELQGEAEGYLVFKQPWPGIMRTVYGNHQRFEETYFSRFPGYYFTGDGAYRDKDGYYWITGRIDDMINVSGHLMSTAEVESALVEHPAVAEAAVVGKPHSVKGLSVYCFVTLRDGFVFSPVLDRELRDKVRDKIGPIATPDTIQDAPGLPKTRSGKIMRRILRSIAAGIREFGDISTLADPSVVEQLIELRPPDRPEHL